MGVEWRPAEMRWVVTMSAGSQDPDEPVAHPVPAPAPGWPAARRPVWRGTRWINRHTRRRPGRGQLDMLSLASPFRYDLVVRAQFFDFLATHDQLHRTSPDVFEAKAIEQPYFTWFTAVAMRRYHPAVADNPAKLRRAYAARVRASQSLMRSFRRSGFDESNPITVRVSAPGAISESGVPVQPGLHMGDGGHRLSLYAIHFGTQHLHAQSYRVYRKPVRLVMDNTIELLRVFDIGQQRYARYLSLTYGATMHSSIDGLLAETRAERPDKLPELDRVIAAHTPFLSGAVEEEPEPSATTPCVLASIWPILNGRAETSSAQSVRGQENPTPGSWRNRWFSGR